MLEVLRALAFPFEGRQAVQPSTELCWFKPPGALLQLVRAGVKLGHFTFEVPHELVHPR